MKRFFRRLFGSNSTQESSRIVPPVASPEPEVESGQRLELEPDTQRNLDNALEGTYRFVAVDVETANQDRSSICQVGLALVGFDDAVLTVGILINPEQEFDAFNIDLHGIDEEAVRNSMTFDSALQLLRAFLERHTLVQHSNFDKSAFNAACEAYGLPKLRSTWIDSVKIAREAWPELNGNGGYGLASLKDHLGLEFKHHDAVEDAVAAASVVLLAEDVTGEDFAELGGAQSPGYRTTVAIEGNQSGPLYGHVACFTGQLSLSRLEAATLAAGAGITVKSGMSKKISLLVVGDQDLTLLAGHTKSSKHRRAEELIEQGQDIRIIDESTFLRMIEDR